MNLLMSMYCEKCSKLNIVKRTKAEEKREKFYHEQLKQLTQNLDKEKTKSKNL